MKCERVQEAFLAYLDGDLLAPDRIRVEVHLDHCYTCQEEVDEMRHIIAMAEGEFHHPFPENRFTQLQGCMRVLETPSVFRMAFARRRARHALGRIALAAALLIVTLAVGPFMKAKAMALQAFPPSTMAPDLPQDFPWHPTIKNYRAALDGEDSDTWLSLARDPRVEARKGAGSNESI